MYKQQQPARRLPRLRPPSHHHVQPAAEQAGRIVSGQRHSQAATSVCTTTCHHYYCNMQIGRLGCQCSLDTVDDVVLMRQVGGAVLICDAGAILAI